MTGQELQLVGGGTLTIREEGALLYVEANRPDDGRGLYKVWVRGGQGRMLLGTLAPEAGTLRLRRRLSRNQLEQERCWPIIGGEAVLAFSFGKDNWVREDHPDLLVKDVVLRQALRGKPMFLRRQENEFQLSISFETERPFPITPLFCLAKVTGGRVIFSFDREGTPILPHNGCQDGEKSGIS